MPLGRNSAQRPMHTDTRPSPWPRHSGARGPLPARPARWHGARRVSTHRSGHHFLGVRRGVASGGATVVKVGRSSIHGGGSPAGQVGEGGSSPELLADEKGRKIRDGGGVLR
jgi:hypothetical protein